MARGARGLGKEIILGNKERLVRGWACGVIKGATKTTNSHRQADSTTSPCWLTRATRLVRLVSDEQDQRIWPSESNDASVTIRISTVSLGTARSAAGEEMVLLHCTEPHVG